MARKKGSEIITISIHERNQPEVLPILDRLRRSDLGISRTICRLLVEYKKRGFLFDETNDL
jgi:hypothetical protein